MSLPVLILSGFLGSGKTTLLLRLLEASHVRGLRPGILMNELGKRDVDSEILRENGDPAVSRLLDGCVCCSKKSELAAGLDTLIRTKPDLLLIELTGVANPEEVADALTEPGLLGKVRIRQIVTLLDAEHLLEYNSVFSADKELVRTLRRQIEVADRIVVNKTDLVSPAVLAKIAKTVRRLNEHASLEHTVRSQLDPEPLLGGIRAGASTATVPVRRDSGFRPEQTGRTAPAARVQAGAPEKPPHAPSFSRVQTLTLEFPYSSALPRRELERFLARLGRPLLRAKGYAVCAGEGMLLLQFAGGRAEWSRARYEGEPYLVLIGLELDEEIVRREWQRLLAAEAQDSGKRG
ncbi:CobW family GTP-binding protein [Gorillibacterium sp. sgz500922]|uniref:CobW family GTP-binding protein n=1 Tax=Gorillibacterium sp. sgz500922 TaxID=3446694 RepID=UPI003F6683B7